MKKSFRVKILGQDLSLLSDAGDEHVEGVVKYVNDKVKEVESTASKMPTLNVAILTALNIADEYFKIKMINDDIYRQLAGRSEKLINLIDDVR